MHAQQSSTFRLKILFSQSKTQLFSKFLDIWQQAAGYLQYILNCQQYKDYRKTGIFME
jgi:hypothetical protein